MKIKRIYCPKCKKLEFQLFSKDKDSWYGTCENCHRYIEGTKNVQKSYFQINYNLIEQMEKDL